MDQNNDLAMGYVMGRDNNNGWNCGGYGGYGGFGNSFGGDWLAILVILALLGGNNGWGFGGNGGNNVLGYELGKVASTNDVASGFSTSAIMSDLNDILLGQTQGFAAVQQTLCQGFSGVNQTLMNGFHGVDNAICTLGYNMQGNINQLSHQLSDCCCQTQRAIDGVNFNAERNACNLQNAIYNATRDIIDSNRCGFDRIAGMLTQQEIDRLRSENQTLRFEKSQSLIFGTHSSPLIRMHRLLNFFADLVETALFLRIWFLTLIAAMIRVLSLIRAEMVAAARIVAAASGNGWRG